tara:strand:- start:392 stop:769 length:378 start_codon:yes stop_codon:yes gene_type:complete
MTNFKSNKLKNKETSSEFKNNSFERKKRSVEKSKEIKDGYEVKSKTITKGDVVKTKKSDKLLANERGDVWVNKSKTKSVGGEIVRSKSVVIDKGGHRKTKIKTNKRGTKLVVIEDGKRTVSKTKH